MVATLGNFEVEKAKSINSAMIKIGTRRRINGGGGSGGKTSGSTSSNAVNTTITTTDLRLKYLDIN